MKSKKFEVIPVYDVESDILYVHKTIEYKYQGSIEVGSNLILDFNENNKPVALEILDASKYFNVKKYSLQHIAGINLELLVDEELIIIKGSFLLQVHNKEISKPFVGETVNDINLPHMKTNFGMAEA